MYQAYAKATAGAWTIVLPAPILHEYTCKPVRTPSVANALETAQTGKSQLTEIVPTVPLCCLLKITLAALELFHIACVRHPVMRQRRVAMSVSALEHDGRSQHGLRVAFVTK